MKNYILLTLALIFLSCNSKLKQEDGCIKKIWFKSRKQELIPSLVKIEIEIYNISLTKKVESGKLENIILYSVKKEDRPYFIKGDYYEIKNNLLTLQLVTSYFDSEKVHKWTSEEIKKVINGDVGFVFKNDTLKLKLCDKK